MDRLFIFMLFIGGMILFGFGLLSGIELREDQTLHFQYDQWRWISIIAGLATTGIAVVCPTKGIK